MGGLPAAGCASLPVARPARVTAGEPEFGRDALVEYGCVSSRTIPGVPGSGAYVGPPLDRWGLRSCIAGSLVNDQPDHGPQAVEPGTAMPDLDVTEEDAAYLLSLD